MRLHRFVACAGLAWVLLSGCAEGPVAGNSSETENTVKAFVLRVDSLLPEGIRPAGTTVATLRLDSSNFDFAAVDSLGLELGVERLDGRGVPFETVFWDKRARRARLHVRLDSALTRPGSYLRVRWGLVPQVRSDSAAVWDALPDSLVQALSSVLVDDFEHGSTRNLLPSSSDWYCSASESASVSLLGLQPSGGGRAGSALGISYQADTVPERFALIGTRLGAGPRSLRGLDSLVVWVRGSGTVFVALDHLQGVKGPKAWMHVELDSSWMRLRVRPEDFDSADGLGGNVGWEGVRDSVTHLTFLVRGGSSLWIDDVRLHGLNRDDLR